MPAPDEKKIKFITKDSLGSQEEKKLNMGLVIALSVFLITLGALVYLYAGLKKATKKPTFTPKPRSEVTGKPTSVPTLKKEEKKVTVSGELGRYINDRLGFATKYFIEWGEPTKEEVDGKTIFKFGPDENLTITVGPHYGADPDKPLSVAQVAEIIGREEGCAEWENTAYDAPAWTVGCGEDPVLAEYLLFQKEETIYIAKCRYEEELARSGVDVFILIDSFKVI